MARTILSPQERIDAYLADPSLASWRGVYSLLIPKTSRTLWQAWIATDGSAQTHLPRGGFTMFPDAFTLRRAIRAATQGKVPVGLQALEAAHQLAPRVPR